MPSDLATLRSGMPFHEVAMFQRARFFVLSAGTSSLLAARLLVHPFGIVLRKRSLRGYRTYLPSRPALPNPNRPLR